MLAVSCRESCWVFLLVDDGRGVTQKCAYRQTRTLWERVYPRRIQLGAWHGLRPCSRVNPLPQGAGV
ncbi:hypothetical protein E5221_17290 [Pseudomonas sp. A2]|nr:hypothetical protein E5221_17290 [Pseudomonas sp. A2]